MNQDEILKQQRTATRLDPSGARSTVYGGAGQVPPGAVTAGTDPMPARVSNIQPPPPAGNPGVIASYRARAAVDPAVAQRVSALQGPQPGAAGGPLPRPAPQPAQPTSFAWRARSAGPAAVQPAAAPSGPTRFAAGVRAAARAAPAAGAAQTTGAPGLIQQAARQTGGRIAAAAASPTGRVIRGVAGAAGAMAAFPTAGMAVDNLMNQPGVASKVAGVGQAALAASAALPGPWGEAGRLANLGYQAFMNTGLPKKLSDALGMGEPAGAPAPVGYSSNPSPAVQQIPMGRGPESAAPAAQSALAAPAAAPVAPAEQAPRGPISQAAQRRTSNKPVGEPSAAAQSNIERLQAMAGQELAGMQQAPAQQGGIQVFGPADGYAGTQRDPIYPGMYNLPAWDGGGASDGPVTVLRGAGGNALASQFDPATQTERAQMPQLTGDSPAELLQFVTATQGSSDPRVAMANKQATELLAAQLGLNAELERQRMASDASVRSAGISAGGGVEQARISAAANRYQFQPGQRVTDALGNTTYTEPVLFDRQTGAPLPGKPERQKPVRPAAQFDAMVAAIARRDGVDEATARALVGQAFTRGE